MLCPSCGHENIDGTDRCDNCLSPFRDLDVPRVDAAEGLARSVMADNLGRLDQEATISVSPETPAKLAGIFTEHDVLRKLTGAEALSTETAVKDLMSPNPEVLHEQDSVAAALNKMSTGRYRHIPVRKSDGSYAVTSIKSLLKYIAKEDW
jgi:CBS domain-containing protein